MAKTTAILKKSRHILDNKSMHTLMLLLYYLFHITWVLLHLHHFYQQVPSACGVSNAFNHFTNLSVQLIQNFKNFSKFTWTCLQLQVYDAPGVEHIPVVQIDLSVPLKVPGEQIYNLLFQNYFLLPNNSTI